MRRTKRRHRPSFHPPRLEALEPRLLLNGDVPDFSAPIDRLGVEGLDELTLAVKGQNLELRDRKNKLVACEALGDVEAVDIIGRADAPDRLTINFGREAFMFSGGISYNGGGGEPIDRLRVIGTDGDDPFDLDGLQLSFFGMPIDTQGTEQLYIDTGRGDDTVDLLGDTDFSRLRITDQQGDDIYKIATVSGNIRIKDLRNGFDVLDFADGTNGINLDLASPDVQTLGLNSTTLQLRGNFEQVIGTDFEDHITGDGQPNLILGLDGTDMLNGGGNHDVLIGGDDTDSLNGGGGHDLLIGGNTTFEPDDDELPAILAEWSRGGSFNQRVLRVRLPNELGDEAFLINGLTLADDEEPDQIDGATGKDFAPLGDADGIVTRVENLTDTFLPTFNSDDFTTPTDIDHPYFPLTPGDAWVYEGEVDGETERVEITVLATTRTVNGITVREVRDHSFVNGVEIEDTIDFFAQDDDGNVWYLGEQVTNFVYNKKGMLVGTNNDGSWAAGVNGARPGFQMVANPTIGFNYFQEFAPFDAALDFAEIVQLDRTLTFGAFPTFNNVHVIREFNMLEPRAVEHKNYAMGTIPGLIYIEEDLNRNFQNPGAIIELISFTAGM